MDYYSDHLPITTVLDLQGTPAQPNPTRNWKATDEKKLQSTLSHHLLELRRPRTKAALDLGIHTNTLSIPEIQGGVDRAVQGRTSGSSTIEAPEQPRAYRGELGSLQSRQEQKGTHHQENAAPSTPTTRRGRITIAARHMKTRQMGKKTRGEVCSEHTYTKRSKNRRGLPRAGRQNRATQTHILPHTTRSGPLRHTRNDVRQPDRATTNHGGRGTMYYTGDSATEGTGAR
ncbi:hypothetical protein BDZ45DRAFT_688974 [Acephala macrosclerotiorum]|nr:hypothetical protein BDZ45DRAFT_688974 [Acephala macrosclerotiorum]